MHISILYKPISADAEFEFPTLGQSEMVSHFNCHCHLVYKKKMPVFLFFPDISWTLEDFFSPPY